MYVHAREEEQRVVGQAWAEEVTNPRHGGGRQCLTQLQCAPSPMPIPSLYLSLTNPALRANSYPKVMVHKKH
jgi:hypothetical protein